MGSYRIRLVFWEIIYSIRVWTFPGDYFQLNADYFNSEKGIFSKLDIDRLIPDKWRLNQQPLEQQTEPAIFPVFIKPEWGQNALGIYRVDTLAEFQKVRNKLLPLDFNHIVQEAAKELREFEVFYTRQAGKQLDYSAFSVTEVKNCGNEQYPVNSIDNELTWYSEVTEDIPDDDKEALWKMIGSIGNFRIARVCCRANNLKELIKGQFHIIEINLYVPLPLYLVADNISNQQKKSFIREQMLNLAKLIKEIPQGQPHKSIFYRKWLTHIKIKSKSMN